jgi:hypothetical protein
MATMTRFGLNPLPWILAVFAAPPGDRPFRGGPI